MLEDVNSVLNAGEIPNLFMPDEVSTIGAPSAHVPERHTCPIGTCARSAHFHHRRPIATRAPSAHLPDRRTFTIGAPSARLPERRTCPIGTIVRRVPVWPVCVRVGGCWGFGGNDGSRSRTRR